MTVFGFPAGRAAHCAPAVAAVCFLAFVACAALTSTASAAERVAIRLNIQPGQAWSFDQTTDTQLTNRGTANGQTQTFESKMRYRRVGRLEILAAQNGRPAAVRVSFGNECESSTEMTGQPPQRAPFALAGRTVTITRAPGGGVQIDAPGQLDPATRSELEHFVDPETAIYPDHDVAVGEEWPGNPQAVAKQLQLQGSNDRAGMTMKLLSVKDVNGRPAAEVKVSSAAFRQQQGLNDKMIMQGTVLVDLGTGHVLQGTLKGTLTRTGTSTGPGPGGQPVTYQVEGEGAQTITIDSPLAGGNAPPPIPSNESVVGANPLAPTNNNPLAAPGGPTAPATPAAAPFAGKFTDGKLTLELRPAGGPGSYEGTITLGAQTFKATATDRNGALDGSFEASGEKFAFSGTLSVDGLAFKTGTSTYALKKQLPASANPLELPGGGNGGANNPLANPPGAAPVPPPPAPPAPRNPLAEPRSAASAPLPPAPEALATPALPPVSAGAAPAGPLPAPPDSQPAANHAIGSAPGLLRLQSVSIMDDSKYIGGEVCKLLIPAGWKVEGGVAWDLRRTFNPATTHLKIYNPNGLEAMTRYPKQTLWWGESPMSRMIARGSLYLGNEVQPIPASAAQAVMQFILPRYRNDLLSAKVVQTEELPEMAQSYLQSEGLVSGQIPPGTSTWAKGVRIRFEYLVGGNPVQEDVFAVIAGLHVQNLQTTFWAIDQACSVRGPGGSLDELNSLYRVVEKSSEPNIQWFAQYQQCIESLKQMQTNAMNAEMDRFWIRVRAQEHISNTIRQTYENRQAALDRIAKSRSQAMRGVSNYDIGGGRVVELPHGYDHVYRGSNGEYILSSVPNYNPNSDPNRSGTYTEIHPAAHP